MTTRQRFWPTRNDNATPFSRPAAAPAAFSDKKRVENGAFARRQEGTRNPAFGGKTRTETMVETRRTEEIREKKEIEEATNLVSEMSYPSLSKVETPSTPMTPSTPSPNPKLSAWASVVMKPAADVISKPPPKKAAVVTKKKESEDEEDQDEYQDKYQDKDQEFNAHLPSGRRRDYDSLW